MLSINLKISLIVLCVIFDIFIYNKVINNKADYKTFISCIFLSTLLIIVTIFDNILIPIRDFLGFEATSNMVFLVGFIFVIITLLTLTLKINEQQNKIIKLTQELAILKKEKSNEKNNK